MLWFALYIAAMFCIALPVALFGKNEVAGAVFAVWGVGQVTYQMGFPEPLTQIVLYGAALGYIARERWCHRMNVPDASYVSAALFAPLLLVCFLWAQGGITRDEAWWPIWCLAMVQAAFLVRPIAWCAGIRRRIARKSTAKKGGNLMVVA